MDNAINKNRRDMLLYVIIGLLTILAITGIVVWVPSNRVPDKKWTQFIFYSLVLYSFLVKIYWRHRTILKLWAILFGSIGVHLSAYLPILSRIDYSPALWYLVTMPLEGVIVMLVTWHFLQIPPDTNVRL